MRCLYLAALFFLLAAVPARAQQNDAPQELPIRPATFGAGFIVHDFVTARNIRSSSLASTINNKQFGKFSTMAPGLAITYVQGLRPNFDFAASISFSSGEVVLENSGNSVRNANFASADASVQAKMFPETFRVIPFLSAGIGASASRGYYGAMVPLGVGLRWRISDDFSLALQSQYRVAVTETAGYHFMHGLTIMGAL